MLNKILVNTLNNLGYQYLMLGILGPAMDALERARGINQGIGARRDLAYAELNIALARLRAQDAPGALASLHTSIAELADQGDEFGRASGLTYQGLALESSGSLQEAAASFRQALEIHLSIGFMTYAMDPKSGLARCALALGRPEELKADPNVTPRGTKRLELSCADPAGAMARARQTPDVRDATMFGDRVHLLVNESATDAAILHELAVQRVVQRKHRPSMDKFGKPFGWSTADPLRRAVGSNEFGMLLFEFAKLLDQRIVFFVRDFGIVFEVVEIFVPANLIAEGVDLFLDG